MTKNYFRAIRKSYVASTLVTTILSNIIVFGQPIEQMGRNNMATKLTNIIKLGYEGYYNSDGKENLKLNESKDPPKAEEKIKNIFYAVEKEGEIGKVSNVDAENPYDNFFTIQLPQTIDLSHYNAKLVYDLYGLSGASQTTKSINNKLSYGGKLVEFDKEWKSVQENIPVSSIENGHNEIYFTRRIDETYQYKIKNLRIELIEKNFDELILAADVLINHGGDVNVMGHVTNPAIEKVWLMGKNLELNNQLFEYVLKDVPEDTRNLEIIYEAKLGERKTLSIPVVYSGDKKIRTFSDIQNQNAAIHIFLPEKENTTFIYESASLELKEDKLFSEVGVKMEGLQFKDLKSISSDIENVGRGKYMGYKVSKLNVEDSITMSLHLSYDPEKIPVGYTERDVKIFFFDKKLKGWKALPVDSLDLKNKTIISSISNETDYINGVLKVPESPETGTFTPTTISDIEFANPAQGIVSVQPPQADYTGTASTSFPIKLPAGRNGLQPQLNVSYNSEAGNGWMGIGWNLSTPAITLNTKWGAPLFDDSFETEIYSLNGADLVLKHQGVYTNPHRYNGNIQRINGANSDKQFYSRKEGSFQKIIRHGNNPENYWWEVTDKQGNKSFYGGYNGMQESTVLKSDKGIGHWALVRTEDVFGNYVEYEYEKNQENISNSTVSAVSFYPKSITYTRHNSLNSYYRVDFIRNTYTVSENGNFSAPTRKDISINARNGYIEITKDLLTELAVSFVNGGQVEPIRKYRFDYLDDDPLFLRFEKQQLQRIAEFDSNGELFYSNTFEYHKDSEDSNFINMQTSTWSGSGDNLGADLTAQLYEASALGTSNVTGTSFSLRTGLGFGGDLASLNLTVGGTFGYDVSWQKGRVQLQDINGDGLPDKLFRKNNKLFYKRNTGTSFGSEVEIPGLDMFNKTRSSTVSLSADASFYAKIGKGWSWTNSKTTDYFLDRNGDGLPDIIKNGRVHFNQTGTDINQRIFDTGVGSSENYIEPGEIDLQIVNNLELESLEEIKELNPQFDAVKVWEAPYTGSISITGIAKLTEVFPIDEGYENKFRFTIEKATPNASSANYVGSSTVVLPNEEGLQSNMQRNLSVNAGDLIFFRIHNLENGTGGKVSWNPEVNYTIIAGYTDENNYLSTKFNFKDDFLLTHGAAYQPSVQQNVSVDLNLNSILPSLNDAAITDDIFFEVKKIHHTLIVNTDPEEESEEIVEEEVIAVVQYNHLNEAFVNNPTTNLSVFMELSSNEWDLLEFNVRSDSNVAWEQIDWQPLISPPGSAMETAQVTYHTYEENISNFKHKIEGTQLPDPNITTLDPSTGADDGNYPLLEITENVHDFNYSDLLAGNDNIIFPVEFQMVVKSRVNGEVKVLEKRHYEINSNFQFNIIGNNNPITITKNEVDVAEELFVAFYTDQVAFAEELTSAEIYIDLTSTEQSQQPAWDAIELDQPFFAKKYSLFGHAYRNWGQLLYNGGIRLPRDENFEIEPNYGPEDVDDFGAEPIDMTVFPNEDDQNVASGFSENSSSEEVPTNIELTPRLLFYSQDNGNQQYLMAEMGSHVKINISEEIEERLERLGESDIFEVYIDPEDLVNNSDGLFIGLPQLSKSKGNSTFWGHFFSTITESSSENREINQYIDMNGDRYPDMITDGKIQYTNSRGAFDRVEGNDFSIKGESEDENGGISFGPFINSSKSTNGKTTGNSTNTQYDAGLVTGDGDTSDKQQWIDINGDGLVDKVFINDAQVWVKLNTGYSFSAESIFWGSANFDKSSSRFNNSGSGSISPSASWVFGMGLSTSTAERLQTILDVTGDGLPDLVYRNYSSVKYYLNTGEKFLETPKQVASLSNFEIDESISSNLMGGYTHSIPFNILGVPFKISFTGSGNGSVSFNRKLESIQDINGDGYVDFLEKGSNDTQIKARLSQIGKTHLLKKVNTPLGGSWEITYKKTGNTYDLPQSKWVMDEVRTNDGFAGDNNFGPDETLTRFSFSDPKYDRRERDFFGFGRVTTMQVDPGSVTNINRKVIQTYHTNNYYLKGAEKTNATYSASNQIQSKDETLYILMDPDDPEVSYNPSASGNLLQAGLDENILDYSRLFVAVASSTSTVYESGQQVSSQKDFIEYSSDGNLLKIIDHGEGGDDAYRSEIQYAAPMIENATGFPSQIQVFQDNSDELLRSREALYNNQGKLQEIKILLNDQNDKNRIFFQYDSFGNLKRVTQLDNLDENQNPFYQEIEEYDAFVKTYPIKFKDAFGNRSTTEYNYLFGVPVYTTDMNEQSMRTRIDDRGRIIEVTGPNELALEPSSPSAWTIRNVYEGETISTNLNSTQYLVNASGSFPAANPGNGNSTDAQHYAVTRHFDPAYAQDNSTATDNQILTVSIVDGLGTAIQLKKTHVSNDVLKWLISGKEHKDVFGRTTEKYLSTVASYPSNISSLSATDLSYDDSESTIDPQLIEYDSRDRQISIQQPGESPATIAYNVEDGMFVQEVTQEVSGVTQSQKTFTDIRGRQRKTLQNGEITTQFAYNAINELVTVTNNDGYETNSIYDKAGRRIEVQHPDQGATTFKFSKAGNLLERKTSNLFQLEGDQSIKYNYTFNRLDEIIYPLTPENNVIYTYGQEGDPLAESHNAVGRLMMQQDASGIQFFGYGRMGELTKNVRSIAVAGRQSYWFYTKWKYDSWNRVNEIIYPDQEKVTYRYNKAGNLKGIMSNLGGDIVKSITYTDYGERSQIVYGNSTITSYDYDIRRRLEIVGHQFNNYDIAKQYSYDAVSNISNIVTLQPGNSIPQAGQIGGPSTYNYVYDNFNRLVHAEGNYTGPNDLTIPLLRQEYELDMEYDNAHRILNKNQLHVQGVVNQLSDNITDPHVKAGTSYILEYGDYATGAFVAGSDYGYQQPHAPRSIIEKPVGSVTSEDDPRIRRKTIEYDANGNQIEITETIGEMEISLRKNLWDEENRLKGVDLDPSSDTKRPIAVYTYDAGGERIVKHNIERLDVASNANNVGQKEQDHIMIYPNALVVGKVVEDEEWQLKYTKHYYAGTERVSARTGTMKELGLFPDKLLDNDIPQLENIVRPISNELVSAAGNYLQGVYTEFDQQYLLNTPINEGDVSNYINIREPFEGYFFHPDHLGSSNYITNLEGTVSQHMEYMAFGETLVEEHLNSNNSPYKFNAKELDEETGNYYYGARYYDPKWSIWLSVDPLVETTMQPYSYVNNNPIFYTDPTGMISEPFDEFDQDGNKISNLGGDKIDFYHQENGDTKIVDRESGASNTIIGGESLIRGYSQRDKNTSWSKLFYEFDLGEGPVNSLLSDFDDTEIGFFGSMNKTNSTYASKGRTAATSSNDTKGLLTFDYSETNPFTAGLDGWEQFLGRANLSYYELGDKVLFLMHDSKSMTSLGLRMMPSWDRSDFKPRGTTKQTYIWTESLPEVRSKANAVQQQGQ